MKMKLRDASGHTSSCIGFINDVSVEFERKEVKRKFSVIWYFSNVIIGYCSIKNLETFIYLESRITTLEIIGANAEL